jgi:tRNA(fMet)-specific endonuclease VapC
MLDTNMVSDFVRNPQGRVAQRINRQGGSTDLAISIIVASELRYGAVRRGSPRLTDQIERTLEFFAVLPFEAPADIVYATIRTRLEAAGRPIGANDLLIAAHALSLDLTLVTANIREFSRVPGPKVENWLD